MDADVAIKDFLSEAYVIERPATANLLADNATSLLAKKGLRIEFGQAQKVQRQHDTLFATSLPDDIGFVSRRHGKATSEMSHGTLISGPRFLSAEQGSPAPAVSMAHKSWTMLGHAINGTDKTEAASFAAMMVVKNSKTADILSHVARNTEAEFGQGHPVAAMVEAISLSSAQMRSAEAFMNKDAYETMATAKAFTAQQKFASAHASNHVIEDRAERGGFFTGSSGHRHPQLGQSDKLEASGRFTVHEFSGPYMGPSHLPGDFGNKSQASAQWLHPDLLKVVARAREIADVKFEIVPGTGGIRSSALQQKLKKAGKSKATVERHTIGHAVDLVPLNRKGNYDFGDHDGFEKIRAAMESAAEELNVPIQWGGNWKKLVDKPHFELDRVFYPAEGEGPDPRIKVEPYEISVAFR